MSYFQIIPPFLDDGTDITPRIPGRNLDIGTGVLKDNDVVGGVPLGEAGATSIATIAPSIIGGINENNGRIDFLEGIGSFTTKIDPALDAISVSDIDDFVGCSILLTGAGNDQNLPNPTVTATWHQYIVINDDTSTDPIDIIGASTRTLNPGEFAKFIWDGTAWISVAGGTMIWIDDGTDIKAANSTRNLDLQAGVLKDNDVIAGIALGDATNTALRAQYAAASLLGSANESKIYRANQPAYAATIAITAAQMSSVWLIDTSGGNVAVTIPDADATTDGLWLRFIKDTDDVGIASVETVSGQPMDGTVLQSISQFAKGFQLYANNANNCYKVIQDSRFGMPTGGTLAFYMSDTASDIGGYLTLFDSDTGEAESSVVSAGLAIGAGQLIEEWATEVNSPGFVGLQAGIYSLHFHAEKTSGTRVVVLYYEIYKRASGGAETLLTTSENSGALATNQDYDLESSLPADEVLAVTDRIVVKMYATVSGGGLDAVVTIFMEGVNASRLSVPVSSAQLDTRYLVKAPFPTTQTIENDLIIAGNVTGMSRTEQDDTLYIKSGKGIKATSTGTSAGTQEHFIEFEPTGDVIKFRHGAILSPSLELKNSQAYVTPITQSTAVTNGALRVAGGVGIAKDVFIGGDLTVDGVIAKSYAEIYLDDNSAGQSVTTLGVPIGVFNYTLGEKTADWAHYAGKARAITAYADYSGTVAGTVKVTTSAAHDLVNGIYITIRGSTNYNEVLQIQIIDAANFYITHSWDGDDGASALTMPTQFLYTGSASRIFTLDWDISVAKSAGSAATVIYVCYVNGTPQVKTSGQEDLPDTDIRHIGGGGIISITTNDWVFITVESTNTDNLTMSYGSLRITE